MLALHELQQQFAAAVLDGDDAILPAILADRLGAERRLNVYCNNTGLTLRGALAATYPVIEKLVGADFFTLCAREYRHAHPSRSGDVSDYGAAFAEFLDTFAPAHELPYLPDVARLEWAYHRAFHAADAAPLDVQRLAAIPAEQHGTLRFALRPGAALIASRYPVLQIWRTNQPDADASTTIDLDQGGEALLVFRAGLDITLAALRAGEAAFLRSLACGTSLEHACKTALNAEPEMDVSQCFARFVALHAVTDFVPDGYPSPQPSPLAGEGQGEG